MVEYQLRARGISDERVNQIMSRLPRHLFVPGRGREEAYGDHPLSIGHEQTISQPYMVGLMTELLQLRGEERILEIGTGSGYQTAVLAELAREVYTVERIPSLLKRARSVLTQLGFYNIHFRLGDGSAGWAEHAPYDGILVAASSPSVPTALKDQLANGGQLVMPVGESFSFQNLVILRRSGRHYETRESIACRFVPLIVGEVAL